MRARSQSALRSGLWGLVIVLGALDAFAGRQYVNADGISYLDHAEAWARGDWRAAVSAYWSPLYSILLIPVVWLAREARAWEAPLAHAVNVVVFLGALVAFELFVRGALALRPGREGDDTRAVRIWAYALFGRAITATATLQLVTPDLLVAAVGFTQAALLCRIAGGDRRRRTFAALGLAVGLGFLAKLVMLVFGVAALAIAVALTRPARRALRGATVAAATAALVAGPFVAALSVAEGRLTLGDAGRLNYIWSQRGPGLVHPPMRLLALWSGGTSRPRMILDSPRAWELDASVPGTVPFWYAPERWNRGESIPVSAAAQGRVLLVSLRELVELLRPWWPALLALALLALTAGRASWSGGRPLWPVALSGIVPFLVYLLVHIEGRYVACALVVLLVVGFLSLPRAEGPARRRREAVAWLVLAALVAPSLAIRAGALARYAGGERPRAAADVAAERLRGLGLRPGDGVAVVGNFFEVGWARVAGVRVVAVVDADDAFGPARGERPPPARVAAALAAAGARAVVSDRGPAPAVAPGEWTVLHAPLHARRLEAAPRR